ncbi:hypothetical protein [uncultured Sphingomonas sp.]|uniref:hypothetical protein n=1 Tax=uncultured Sphingomonas sp. TaxID=158754 RepID=UPI0025FA9F8D|nr:hypothetical protein [uncultured Sphingomonas sp.]
MTMHHRIGEMLSDERHCRLAIFYRPDHRFVIVEERILSQDRGDAENPDVIPFPTGAEWQPYWTIDARPRAGLFGTIEDALSAARMSLNGLP